MSSGVSRVVNGSLTGETGVVKEVHTVGFRPKRVEVFNVGGLAKADWHSDMADDSMVLQITAGTMTLETSDGIIPLSDGFSIGANGDLNVDDELIHWTAYE